MNHRNTILLSLSLSVLLGSAIANAQTQPSPRVSSSLGGPITPTQPNFFAESTTPILPSSLNQTLDSSSLSKQPILSNTDKPVTPLVGDPPRPSRGGIINIKMD